MPATTSVAIARSRESRERVDIVIRSSVGRERAGGLLVRLNGGWTSDPRAWFPSRMHDATGPDEADEREGEEVSM